MYRFVYLKREMGAPLYELEKLIRTQPVDKVECPKLTLQFIFLYGSLLLWLKILD